MAVEQLPSCQRAVQQGDDGKPYVANDANIPIIPPGYVLVKTTVVALNPSDYKILRNFPLPGCFTGVDLAGVVVKVGDNVDPKAFPPGMVVSGAVYAFTPETRLLSGAFAEYALLGADLLLRVPPPSPGETPLMAQIRAATLGTACATCILSFWAPDALALSGNPDIPDRSETPIQVLVYGGSTATGTIAIQLLKFSGYDPIATCSPANFELVRGRGASAVFDYTQLDVGAAIKRHTGGRLKYAMDCISDEESVSICYEAIQRPGGRYVSLEHVADQHLAKRRAVRPTFVEAGETAGEGIRLGLEGYDRPANMEKRALASRHVAMLQRLVDAGRLKTHPTEVLEGGLEGAVRGLEVLASGKVSGKKLVAVVSDQ